MEIALVGDPDSADTQALLNAVCDGYQPFRVVALGAPSAQPADVPLLQDRALVDGRAAAWVCRDSTWRPRQRSQKRYDTRWAAECSPLAAEEA